MSKNTKLGKQLGGRGFVKKFTSWKEGAKFLSWKGGVCEKVH